MNFTRAVKDDADMHAALADLHVVVIDVDTDHGKTVRERYNVRGYPTFVLLNHQGETVDRWLGYDKPAGFIATLGKAGSDMRTVAEKQAAFKAEPTLALARALARDAVGGSRYAEAVTYYQRAQELAPDEAHTYLYPIFEATARGARTGQFMPAQINAAADQVMQSPRRTPDDVCRVADIMVKVAGAMGVPQLMQPYVEQALAETEGTEDESIQRRRTDLALVQALKLEQDVDKALAIKRASMSAGWQDDADQLNNFAWWCFEADVNLDEAMTLARRAVDLAEKDTQKANILDTLAEICNARGDCNEAIGLMQQAVALDPSKQYLKDQLAKFQKLQAGS